MSSAPSSPSSSTSPTLPLLFGRARHLLGWQGYTAPLPAEWNPGKFSGNREKGDLRIDDENGPRLELRWESTNKTPDVAKSIDNFLKQLAKDAKKRGEEFTRIEDAKVVSKSRKRKEQIVNFGWKSSNAQTPCVFGAAWHCPTCKRVTFAHILGQRGDTPSKIERLAGEIFNALECHGEGGWDSWSFFDVSVEIPTEFELARAQLLLNKIECEWVRIRPNGLYGWGKRAERIVVSRYPVANVLLDGKTLGEWADWNVRHKSKQLSFGEGEPDTIHGHDAIRFTGLAKDLKSRLEVWVFDHLMRRRTPKGTALVWQCPPSNRLFVLESEVSNVNEHVPHDVLDSLACH